MQAPVHSEARDDALTFPRFRPSLPSAPTAPQVYKQGCTFAAQQSQCQFQNPLSMDPRNPPSSLSCLVSEYTLAPLPGQGNCLLGPNKHGDACNDNAECASGTCSKKLKVCQGIQVGLPCKAPTVGASDPCAPGYWCSPGQGTCMPQLPVMSASQPPVMCNSAASCPLGQFCSGGYPDNSTYCTTPYTIGNGMMTTIGPYMCVSGNAVMTVQGATNAQSTFLCMPAPAKAPTGNIAVDGAANGLVPPCQSASPAPAGYNCTCALADGQNHLAPVMGLGLAARSAAWQALYSCLSTAKGITGDACQFDMYDMESIRYGSCVFYACFPQYAALANSAGSRFLNAPMSYFSTMAPCEKQAATNYYAAVLNAACVSIPGMESE